MAIEAESRASLGVDNDGRPVNSTPPRADDGLMGSGRLVPIGFVVLATGLGTAIVVAPGDRLASAIASTVGAVAALALMIRAARSHPALQAPWALVAVGVLVWTGAAVAGFERSVDHPGLAGATTGWRATPGLAEALFVLGVPWLVLGVVALSPTNQRARRRTAPIELAVLAVSSVAVLWLVAVEPLLAGTTLPFRSGTWYLAFALVDVLLLVSVLRMAAITSTDRNRSVLLGLAFVAALVAHALGWWAIEEASETVDRVVLAVQTAALLFLGAAATVARGDDRARDDPESGVPVVRPARVVALTAAAAAPLIALALAFLVGPSTITSSSVVVVGLASVVLASSVVACVWAMVPHVIEVTERHGQTRLAAMVEYSNDVVMITDAVGTVTYASPGLTAALGHRPGEWLGRRVIDVVDEPERRRAVERFTELLDHGLNHTVEFETVLVRRDGQRRHGDVVMVNLLADEAVGGVVVTFRDITEQRDLERQLSHRAFHDELTGLANRALFLDRMDHALRIGRGDSQPVMVLFIDLDDFKVVNDVHGHGVGDETLRLIAGRIRDEVGAGDTAARLGGDEFAVLLEDGGGIDGAIDLAERLLARLREPVVVGGAEVVVLASIGIALAPTGANTTSVLRDADIAMYEAKRAGKGQVRIFDPAMRRLASRHLAYRNELSSAVERGQLRVVYLPYVDLRTGEVHGAEALVRWHHPEHGEIAPSEFVPIAERTGLIVPIGRWVIGEALDQLLGWRSDADLFVSVNLSATELRQPDLVDHVSEAIRARGVDPRRVMFEVTETDLIDGADRAAATVAALRELGCRVALDDFGAGACSLSHLQRHPVDMLKIDRAYVAELGRDATDTSLARAILRLADTLQIASAAEGIETPEQLRELRRSGCGLGQGHLLSTALEAPVVARRFGRSTGQRTTVRS